MCSTWLYKCKRGEEVILGIVPFFHVYGVTMVMILSVMQAYKMIFLPKFDIETTLKTIQKQRPTLFPGAPTIYIGILNHPELRDMIFPPLIPVLVDLHRYPLKYKKSLKRQQEENLSKAMD